MFAEATFAESFAQGFACLFLFIALSAWYFGRKVKEIDKGGEIKDAAKGAAIRALGNLFKK
jgi:hypothetical protein